jgi:MarR family 2-MHQ and catechol resistance regulon transcriptional repressor
MKKTAYRGPRDQVRALGAYVKLMRAADSVTTRVHRHLARAGLTVSQFAALEALHHLGPLTQKDIARKILKSGGNITMVIDNLEKRGLVTRTRGAEDRRRVFVRLTPTGAGIIGRIFPGHAEGITGAMAVLTPAEQEQLSRLCRKLGLAKGDNHER